MLSSESGLVETTLLLLLNEQDCVMLLLWQAVQSALHLQNTELQNLIPVQMVIASFDFYRIAAYALKSASYNQAQLTLLDCIGCLHLHCQNLW